MQASFVGFSMPLFLEKIREHKMPMPGEIRHFILNLASCPDEQVGAFLAHAYHQPLCRESMVELTLAMRDSGHKLNWQGFDRPVVDKHSTGGVGDKTTILLAPLVAALGMAMPTIAGRGLGFSGGTVDKLEAIPGFSCQMTASHFETLVREYGTAFGAQTSDIAPADRKLYQMRDVTATVESIPLITASILSKKLAESLGYLVMDVKWGNGAFMATLEKARALAKSIVTTAHDAGTQTQALLTNMNQPLGFVSGNWCEVVEAANLLKNNDVTMKISAQDTLRLTRELAANLLLQTKLMTTRDAALTKIDNVLASGRPFEIFCQVVAAQGGDAQLFEKALVTIPETKHKITVRAKDDGFVTSIHTKALGQALVCAKAGREKQDDVIDPVTSLCHPVKVGDRVQHGDVLCELTTNHGENLAAIKNLLEAAYVVGPDAVTVLPLISEVIA